MKTSQLRVLSREELIAKGADAREEIFRLRLQQSSGSLEKPSRLLELRKLVARVETLLREAELGIERAVKPAGEKKDRKKKEKA
ncbi:50S ribosomal subunit protein L29 (modular protein) [Methylacidimicrobium sp. AP8]|uniref:50S ribosomal protein L29 n=1 Tax=Methylacidimicrobium sp. AP8 TaxID=2730359 RepID=UPI0018C0B53D|nr:50S ribosomal protein L29 [Methylacidimicrobium sp. AP8]CAB4243855.1 50S ribosomal subunit protein L29 (modular protein) [Methylacidimicrobium sp. AP8]